MVSLLDGCGPVVRQNPPSGKNVRQTEVAYFITSRIQRIRRGLEQETLCGSLNWGCPPSHHLRICLDTWSPVGRALWKGLGGVV